MIEVVKEGGVYERFWLPTENFLRQNSYARFGLPIRKFSKIEFLCTFWAPNSKTF